MLLFLNVSLSFLLGSRAISCVIGFLNFYLITFAVIDRARQLCVVVC